MLVGRYITLEIKETTRKNTYLGHVSILTPLNAALVKFIGTPSVVSMM